MTVVLTPCQLLDLRHPHRHLCMPLAADPRRPHAGEADRSKGTIQSSACQQLPSGILGIFPPDGWVRTGSRCRVLCRHHLDLHQTLTPDALTWHTQNKSCLLTSWNPARWRKLTGYFHAHTSGTPGALMKGSVIDHGQGGHAEGCHRMCHPQSSQCQHMVLQH